MPSRPSKDRMEKLATVGVPPDRIEATGEHLRIVFSPEQADRFCTALAVLEENSAVRSMLEAVWA